MSYLTTTFNPGVDVLGSRKVTRLIEGERFGKKVPPLKPLFQELKQTNNRQPKKRVALED